MARKFGKSGILHQAGRGEIQQPRSYDAAAPPDLRDIAQIEIVLVMLAVAQGRGFRVGGVILLPRVGIAQDAEPFRVGRHETILDAVVHHLHEVAGPARTAVQIALFGGAVELLPAWSARDRSSAWRAG